MRQSIIVSSLLLMSCSEYELNSKADILNANDDETGLIPGDDTVLTPGVCPDPTDPGPKAVTINDVCYVEPEIGTFSPVLEWRYGDQVFCGPSAVGQLIDTNNSGGIDSEDIPTVVLYQGGSVVALNGDTGTPAWITAGNHYGSFVMGGYSGDYGGLALGDVDGNGTPDVVTAGIGSVCAVDGQTGMELWCNNNLYANMDPYGYSYPSIADMDADGFAEVIIGNTILNGSDGTIRGTGPYGRGSAPYYLAADTYGLNSVAIDLDNDGQLELVTGNAAYDANGNTVWYNGGLDGLIAVADFDGDGQGEIVKTSGAYITGMETDGTEVWTVSFAMGSYLAIGTPAIDDLDGDDVPEIVFAVQNNLIAMEWGGMELWRAVISDYTGAAGPALFDFEMDGYPEVLYQDESSIRFYDGQTGALKFESAAHGSVTILETPIVADVDGDDQVEIVVAHCDLVSFSYSGISVFGDADQSWPPGRKYWNQHGYYISNIADDGTIPTSESNNFSSYNSFRSGDVGLPPSEYYDLWPEIIDVCEEECGDGTVYVTARIANAGNITAPAAIPISLRAGWGGMILDSQLTTAEIPSGTTGEIITFSIPSGFLAGLEPVVSADEDSAGYGVLYECDEVNNAVTWGDTVCD